MHTHADKTQENKTQSFANEVSQKQSSGESTFQFVDNRPEAMQLKAFQEMANNSPQVKQVTQLQAIADNYTARQQQPIQKKENNTGLPDKLKSGIENLSGFSMDNVKVHYNSDKPAQLNAHAYAQGTDIHLGSGQEKHLPHEAWHVVQQKQGRVKPTMQTKSQININDDAGFENEADQMGAKALKIGVKDEKLLEHPLQQKQINSLNVITAAGLNDLNPIQRKRDIGAPQTLEDFGDNHARRGDDRTAEDTIETVQGNYNKSLTSGEKVMTEGLKWFTNAPDKKPAISTATTAGKVEAAGYQVFWFFKGEDSVTIMMTRGSAAGDSKSKEVSGYGFDEFGDDQDFLYANTFNVLTGAFHASINYRKQDDEMAASEGLPPALPNSEIIWFMQAYAKQVYAEKNAEAGPLSTLMSISREQIGNTQTLDTIFMCDENRVAYTNGTVTIGTPTEEAIALLGSPNGNSAVWVLIQHAASGTVDIEKIEFSKDGLIIHYMPG